MTTDLDRRREQMVEAQIVARGLRDERVLDAMRHLPRHRFVPPELESNAYEDRPLSIGWGQTISQPLIVAMMTASLKLQSEHRVLEIGTGSGYQAAVLAQLARHVTTIERHERLAASAQSLFAELGILNVTVLIGDGTLGVPDGAPYDRILVTAGAPAVPAALQTQLADGGRLLIPIGPPSLQYLTAVDRHGEAFETQAGSPCIFVPLIGQEGWPA
ncbi:protein-L-isoaspartate(D-aspartate) O-methyltransferase [soil metagenome]